jgi:hypothetical protein
MGDMILVPNRGSLNDDTQVRRAANCPNFWRFAPKPHAGAKVPVQPFRLNSRLIKLGLLDMFRAPVAPSGYLARPPA